jgi:hypothetical protein
LENIMLNLAGINPRLAGATALHKVHGNIAAPLFSKVKYVGIYTGDWALMRQFNEKLVLCSTYATAKMIASLAFKDDSENYHIAAVITPSQSVAAKLYRKLASK